MKLTYYYSACVGIKSTYISVLCDPWFTDGIYDGSWYQYPKLENPVEVIGKYDYIYISHIHGDHYDPIFLKEYLRKYPDTKIIIADFSHNYLEKKMRQDGFSPEVGYLFSSSKYIKNQNIRSQVDIHLLPCGSGINVIDSALVIVETTDNRTNSKVDTSSIVNMNDCPYNEEQLNKIKEIAPNPKIALLGYSGAGPYPQKYFDFNTEKEDLIEAAKEKKQEMFSRYLSFANYLGADKNLPFAGIYILGGDNSHLNRYRGVSDAVEVKSIDKNAFVLNTNGYIDTNDMVPHSQRAIPYSEDEIEDYAKTNCNIPTTSDTLFKNLDYNKIPWERLLVKCYLNAHKKSEVDRDHYIAINYGEKNEKYILFNTNKNKKPDFTFMESDPLPTIKSGHPLYKIYSVDYKYLFGLITGIFHWNNAEVGSHLQAKRYPDVFIREVHNFLNFYQVI